jgi:hypothetical protein
MNLVIRACFVMLIGILSAPAHAESLRCNGQIASEGDSRLSVLYKCGEPLAKDNYCAAIYAYGALEPIPEPFASAYFPCLRIEDWVYDRGPGNLLATVRFRSGVVQSITYGRYPR